MRLAFWRPRPVSALMKPPEPYNPVAELTRMLARQLGALPPHLRQDTLWVMDPAWRQRLTILEAVIDADQLPGEPGDLAGSTFLLGQAVSVIDGGGFPHLEPRSRAAHGTAPRRVPAATYDDTARPAGIHPYRS